MTTDPTTLRDALAYHDDMPLPRASTFELAAAIAADAALDFNAVAPTREEYDRRILLVTLTSTARALAAARATPPAGLVDALEEHAPDIDLGTHCLCGWTGWDPVTKSHLDWHEGHLLPIVRAALAQPATGPSRAEGGS